MAVKRPQKSRMTNLAKNLVFWALIITVGLVIWAAYQGPVPKDVALSEVVERANKGEIKKIEQTGDQLFITLPNEDKATEKTVMPPSTNVKDLDMDLKKVEFTAKQPADNSLLFNLLSIGLGTLVIGAIFFFILRQAQGQNNQALGFGKSKARLYGNEKKKVVFDDIAGNDNAKQDLTEVVDFLKHPKKFKEVGAKIPKGVLLVGPPGTGKTLLSRAVAGEAGVPFFSISGSEFVEMFVGVGASRVRDLFAKAKKNAPCIIFIDEIDAVGRRRGSGMGGGHDEREQTLNQILVEMDGFEQDTNVIVLAATNRSDVLDPALLRPGRFDRRVVINLPERKDRESILKVHFKDKPIDRSVNLDALAAKTAGSSGADLANIANEAAIIAARLNRKTITNKDVTAAFEKIAIGPERKTKVMNEKEKKLTAYHEAGHAVVGHVLPDNDPVHKVTIIPRGGTGGVTWFLPPEDKSYTSIVQFKDSLASALGGRIAEKIIFGEDHVTTGAGSDLRKATEIARDMVIEQGMGKTLRDQVFHEDNSGMMFDRMVHDRPYSDETARTIDQEVAALITEAGHRADIVLRANMKPLKMMANALLEKETLEGDEAQELLDEAGAKLPAAAKLY